MTINPCIISDKEQTTTSKAIQNQNFINDCFHEPGIAGSAHAQDFSTFTAAWSLDATDDSDFGINSTP